MSGSTSPVPGLNKLKCLHKTRIKKTFYRMVSVEDAESILSTGQSFAHGGRYNMQGEFGALYLGESPEVCKREKLKQVAYNPELLPAQVLGSIRVDILNALDLTDTKNLNILGLSQDQLTDPLDTTLTLSIGQAARGLGVNALLVPSAAGPGKNLVIFDEHLFDPTSDLKLLGVEKYSNRSV